MAYTVEIKESAWKELSSFPRNDQEKIRDKIDGLKDDPRPSGCTKLRGEDDAYRIRCGNYRVIYVVNDGILVVSVIKIGHRREVYR